MSEENEKKDIIERLRDKLGEDSAYKRSFPDIPLSDKVEKGISGNISEGYQPTRNIFGPPPGADDPDGNEGEE